MFISGETMSAENQTATNADWLVGNPSRTESAAALWIGSAGLLVLGLQPILLGALFTDGRTTLDELALIATIEIIAIAIGSAIAALFLSTGHLRPKSAILLLLLAVLNFAMIYAGSATAILGIRAAAGLVEGGMVAISAELIARARNAERFGGFFVTLQTLAQSALAAICALWAVPAWGSNGGFAVLGLVCLASLPVAAYVPAAYAPLPKSPGKMDGIWTLKSITVLLAIFLFFAFIGSIWAFLEPLGAQYGISAQSVGLLVSISLAVQVAGAIAATWAQARLDYRLVIFVCGAIGIAAAAVLGNGPSPTLFWAAVLAISFLWMFVIPYQIGWAASADPSRQSALLVPAANLLGAALGPLAASTLIVGTNVSAIPAFAIGAAAASLVLLALFLAAWRQPATV